MYKCKNHIINVLPGKYSITDYNTCNIDNNYIQFTPLLCQKCGKEDRIIYSQGLCKSCYYSDKQYNVKPREYNYQPRPKKENIERIEKIRLIEELRIEGKTYEEIGKIMGLSKQRVSCLYNSKKNSQK